MKKITLLLFISIFILAITSCSKEKVLVMGTNDAFPPFASMGGESGVEMVGFDIELANKIAEKHDAKLQIKVMSFDNLLTSVAAGDIDMALCSITATEERGKIVDFSDPYYMASQVAVVRREDESIYANISTKEQLGVSGKLAAQVGTTGYSAAQQIADGRPVVEFDSWVMALVELSIKNIDIAILDKESARAFTSQYTNLIKLNHIAFDSEQYAVAVKKGNSKLLSSVNDTIAEIIASGEHEALIEKYVNAYSE